MILTQILITMNLKKRKLINHQCLKKMFGRVLKNSMSKDANRRSAGFTLTEVVVASSLLIMAMVPILKGLTSVHLTASLVEQRTKSLDYAQTILEDIKVRSVYDFTGNYNKVNRGVDDVIDGVDESYLYTSTAVAMGADLRRMTVVTGYDKNHNGVLQAAEVLVTLDTLIARRW